MAEVRLGCAALDGADVQSVVEGVPSAAEIGEASATLEEASEDQILVVCGGSVVGYATIRRWQERDDTWLYLHRGWLLPEHRRQGIGSAMLRWAEDRIRRLVAQHGTAGTAVIGANAMASERDATALLLAAGYRRVFSLVELELNDLRQLPGPGIEPAAGIRTGPVGAPTTVRPGGRSSTPTRTGASRRSGPSRNSSTAPSRHAGGPPGRAMTWSAWLSAPSVATPAPWERSKSSASGRTGDASASAAFSCWTGCGPFANTARRPPGCSRARRTRTGRTTSTRAWGSGGGTSTSATASGLVDGCVDGPLADPGRSQRSTGRHSNITIVASSRSRLSWASTTEWMSRRSVSGGSSPVAVARMT